MFFGQMGILFAQTSKTEFPKDKALMMLLFFGAACVVSLIGLFAPKDLLKSMAGMIGTQNVLIARVVCGIGVAVCGILSLVSALALFGVL